MSARILAPVIASISLFCISFSFAADSNMQILLRRARQNDIQAQFYLGNAYANGLGIASNPEQAAYWYKKAAEQGKPGAQYNLGLACLAVF